MIELRLLQVIIVIVIIDQRPNAGLKVVHHQAIHRPSLSQLPVVVEVEQIQVLLILPQQTVVVVVVIIKLAVVVVEVAVVVVAEVA